MVIKAKLVNKASDPLNILFNELVVVGADPGISITAVAATIPPHHSSLKAVRQRGFALIPHTRSASLPHSTAMSLSTRKA